MDGALVREIGIKALLIGGGTLILFWTFNAVKLVIGARGINPLVKQFFDQIASGQIDGAYRLTTKEYRQHVSRKDFLKFLGSLQLNRYKNLKSGRPRIEDNLIILTLKLKSEDKKIELPLDFSFIKVDSVWRINRIARGTS
ncbi:hypothetical protein [Prochlorococcus marinus]|uniref:DUF4878 domain-containing protein n=1 Tax=Prochlorococcus marinus (strain MIT 9211) TaxID=93059 RepID=A9BDC4_PROM4|nr:hypothetical protein [Prochlorococcus marinus]ABX09737.1 conserved hypothetical protein [Prochlorococcus marinus str. MIT 9211]